MKGIIYKWTNKLNNKVYIGQTIHPEQRKKTHEHCIDDNKFHTALRYYGLMNFDYSIIEEVEEENLDKREKYWIRYYDSYRNGYNSDKGGGQKHIKEIRQSKKELGKFTGGRITFGYKIDEDGNYIINDKESKIVRSIFEDYSNGLGMLQLHNKYNINLGTIQNILNREEYTGTNNKPKIIEKELFDRSQLQKTKYKVRHKEGQHPLKGILYNENNKLFTTNNAQKRFLIKSTNETVSYNVVDFLISNIDFNYDKIKIKRVSYFYIKFDIYYKNEFKKSLIIRTYPLSMCK